MIQSGEGALQKLLHSHCWELNCTGPTTTASSCGNFVHLLDVPAPWLHGDYFLLIPPEDEVHLSLSPSFQSRQSSDNPLASAEIGESILALMEEVGFNSSVLWPGYFNCFELYLQVRSPLICLSETLMYVRSITCRPATLRGQTITLTGKDFASERASKEKQGEAGEGGQNIHAHEMGLDPSIKN